MIYAANFQSMFWNFMTHILGNSLVKISNSNHKEVQYLLYAEHKASCVKARGKWKKVCLKKKKKNVST